MCSSSCDSQKSGNSPDDLNDIDSNSPNTSGGEKFDFLTAPRSYRSVSCSPRDFNLKSDSSVSDSKFVRTKKHNRKKNTRALPPIGVFWDIENCQVPKTKNATSVVQRIRELFYDDYREAEFLVVCDVKKESTQLVQDLNDAQVNLIHVSSTSKNAADEKLRQSLRRFAELHQAPAAVALISSDINFAADLSDLRYRKKMRVILIHNKSVADALLLCALKTYCFTSIIETVPCILKSKVTAQQTDLYVFNLPINSNSNAMKSRLKMLSNNCGGKVVDVNSTLGCAVIRFSSNDVAKRAQKRLDGEDVFGNKIRLSNPTTARDSPFKSCSGRNARNPDILNHQIPPVLMPQSYTGSTFCSGTGPENNSIFRAPWNIEVNHQELYNSQQSIFRPIRGSGYMDASYCQDAPTSSSNPATPPTAPVDLVISNLDASIDLIDLRSILLKALKQYATVLYLTFSLQADGSQSANVKVGSQQEAQLLISKLHRLWGLGNRRISISFNQQSSDLDQLRMIISALLQEVPNHQMPLFKFFELAESRYHRSISLSEVNKLKDVCRIIEDYNIRMIVLTPKARSSPISTTLCSSLYCTTHYPNELEGRGWAEIEDITLPNINIPLKVFAIKVNELLKLHMGHLPLLSFPICYSHHFGPLPVDDDNGVPLEHLVTCIINVELTCSRQNKNAKFLRVKETKEKEETTEDVLAKSVSPSLIPNINMLCRKVVDLLKTTDRCQLPMSRYIPTYHHHFRSQCRVADYGFTRLIDLFEAISHVVQILGSGEKRTITLTHSAQMRRFTSDLLRVLKGQLSKELILTDFPAAYENMMHKPFSPVEYGLCNLDDLLEEIPESTIIISRKNNTITVAIPKREQTAEEIQRTKQFASEVIELLQHAPHCSMSFNKFVPAYHHNFGRQCKVSDYGFTKLVELFKAIPETVELEGTSDVDRRVKLTLHLSLNALGTQILSLIEEFKVLTLRLSTLPDVFKREYGYTLKPEAYSCSNIEELVSKLSDFVQITHGAGYPVIIRTDLDLRMLEIQTWSLLMQPPHSLSLTTFVHHYRIRFLYVLPITKLERLKENGCITITNNGLESIISLTNYYILAAQIYHLLYATGGRAQLTALEYCYFRKFGQLVHLKEYGARSFEDLLRKMSFLVVVNGNDSEQLIVTLNADLSAYGINLPPTIFNKNDSLTYSSSISDFLFGKMKRRRSPPKPDTPPSRNQRNSSFWSTPPTPKEELNLNLVLPPPSVNSAMLLLNADLFSPTFNLLSPRASSANPVIPKISAPNPADLPLPDKLISKDDSNDSGVNGSTKIESTLSDNEMYVYEQFPRSGARPDIFNFQFSQIRDD